MNMYIVLLRILYIRIYRRISREWRESFAAEILIQRALSIRMSDTLPARSVQFGMQDTQLCYGTDVISATCPRSFAFCRMHIALTIAQTRIRTHAPLSTTERSRRRNKFEFPMPPVKFPYQCPDYICITVHARPTTGDDGGRRGTTRKDGCALVKMRESARCSLLPPSETSNTRERSFRSDTNINLDFD